MAVEVQMPNLGLSIAEGTIEHWLKKEGDPVEKGDILVVIMTEKVSVDIPAEVSGILLKILCLAKTKVKVGEIIAVIGSAGESSPSLSRPMATASAASGQQNARPQSALRERGDLKVSPLAVKIAAEHGVDIREVAAQFPGKKIGKEEVLSFIERKKERSPEKQTQTSISQGGESGIEEARPLSGPMRAMAEHMALSARTAARVTTMAEVDMTELVKLRKALKDKFQQEYQVNLTFVPFVIRAMVEGIREFPVLNASLRGGEVIFHHSVNVGVAVDTGESLLVPVVKNAGQKNIPELGREVGQISDKAREGKLSLQDIQGGTISLTNAGVYGALLATPVIHQPQSAILWMGKVMETPVVRDGQIVIRSMMYLCLSYDHRIIMGAQAVRFLQVIKKNLETPYPLLV